MKKFSSCRKLFNYFFLLLSEVLINLYSFFQDNPNFYTSQPFTSYDPYSSASAAGNYSNGWGDPQATLPQYSNIASSAAMHHSQNNNSPTPPMAHGSAPNSSSPAPSLTSSSAAAAAAAALQANSGMDYATASLVAASNGYSPYGTSSAASGATTYNIDNGK